LEISMGEILYTEELAARLRRPKATLRYWRVNGEGPRSFKLGHRIAYKAEDVDAWIEAQYAKAAGGDGAA
jgi:predicted DNA-binding transcriptional regulator AlpA